MELLALAFIPSVVAVLMFPLGRAYQKYIVEKKENEDGK